MVKLVFTKIYMSQDENDIVIYKDDDKMPMLLRKTHWISLVQVVQNTPEYKILFEGSFSAAATYLAANNYQYLFGSNGQWGHPKVLTPTAIVAKIKSLCRGFFNGRVAAIPNNRPLVR